jgi:hypothetical protein
MRYWKAEQGGNGNVNASKTEYPWILMSLVGVYRSKGTEGDIF